MNIKRLSTVAATGALTLGLALGAPGTANAAVKAKDVPSKADIVKIFPAVKAGEFATDKSKKVTTPTTKCGTIKTVKVKSSFSTAGSTGTVTVSAGVAEFGSVAAAKKFFKQYKAVVKKCKTYTVSGVKVTVKSAKAPKVGQERLALTQVTSYSGINSHGSTVVIRQGKRIGVAAAFDSTKVSSAKMTKLAKVTAKKMK
ncbi:hypothetical protein NODU109028_01640 [Nocardioides dubius]|uniref:PknH-like extracellular domain-containing protein n=1 Tax=Nocardioides dubius TaxID=317019 RepID=A0ABN1TTA2_9ACTN